jgi:hypothetical protein
MCPERATQEAEMEKSTAICQQSMWCGSMRVRLGRHFPSCGVFTLVFVLAMANLAFAAPADAPGELRVLSPIVRGNLALFPVISAQARDTSFLLTLDEGIRSGQVTVTEAGDDRGLIRPIRPVQVVPPRHGGAEVNRLELTNNSARPLLLLAGEIVTGGKQDRVIGADRIVPPNSGPIDLGVFCVEPGRWVASSSNFGSMGAQMVQPSVRKPAMAERSQSSVWENVRASNAKMAQNLSAPEAAQLSAITSYAKVFSSAPVAKAVAQYGGLEGEHTMLRELQAKGAVGVVVAIDGEVVWADIFASTDLLAKYWPKLLRSYVAEAMTSGQSSRLSTVQAAQSYVNQLSGGREVIETDPGVFRRADITGDGYRVFQLTSLAPRFPFVVHIAKMQQ